MRQFVLTCLLLGSFKITTAQWTWANLYGDINITSVSGWTEFTPAYAVAGTENGLIGLDIYAYQSFLFETSNSGLESNAITCLGNAFFWPSGMAQAVGTESDLYLFFPDSNQWIHFTSANSPLPNDTINYLLSQSSGIWIATNGGLAALDENLNWSTIWTTANTPLPSNHINSICFKNIVPSGWYIGTKEGLAIRCVNPDTSWTVLNTSNSGLPENDITATYWHGSGLLFGTRSHGTADSLLGNTWVYFNQNNGLSSDSITFIVPGTFLIGGDSWIGTKGGGLVYYQNGTPIGHVDTVSGIGFQDANDAAFSQNFETATAWIATDEGLLVQDFGYSIESISSNQFFIEGLINGVDLIISLMSTSPETSTIELFDLLGRKLLTSKQSVGSGHSTIHMNVGYLTAGIYMVRATTNKMQQTIKLSKQN